MASLSISADGLKRVRFKGADGQRRTIRLGRLAKKDAETVRSYVSRLESSQQIGKPPDLDTLNWLDRISDELHSKLARVGLVAERQCATLGGFIDKYIASKAIKKQNTAKNYAATRKSLLEFFGAETPLASITPGACDEWRDSQVAKGYSPATIGRNVKRARQFFRAAVRHNLRTDNPLAEVKAPAQVNKSREFFVTREVTEKVIAACPDAEWRLIVSLARYGGLRCPSEHLALRWGDVDWERERIRVRSPKTEHHPDGASRLIPMFPELRPHLEAVFDLAESGTEYVIRRYRDSNANLRTQLLRIIDRAGAEPWPKLFQNLRASRETELTETYPIQVTCAWIGNSEAVAKSHYLQVTEDHFRRATAPTPDHGGTRAESVAQNPAHAAPVWGGNTQYKKGEGLVFPEEYEPLLTCTNDHVPPRGVEPLSSD